MSSILCVPSQIVAQTPAIEGALLPKVVEVQRPTVVVLLCRFKDGSWATDPQQQQQQQPVTFMGDPFMYDPFMEDPFTEDPFMEDPNTLAWPGDDIRAQCHDVTQVTELERD